MPRSILMSTCLGVLIAAPAFPQDSAPLVDIITINAHRTTTDGSTLDAQEMASHMTPDTTAVLARLPGVSAISNGALSGQVQYRGLFGSRVNIRLNGRAFESGGPNLMDPPMHYAPAALLEQITIDRGIAPVSAGPGLAGGLDARFKSIDFSESDTLSHATEFSLSGQSIDEGWSRSAMSGIATERFRVYAFGAQESGEDYSAPDTPVAGTRYDRLIYGLGAGFRSGAHEIALSFRRNETGPTGNPQFAMDIRYVDSDFIEFDHDMSLAGWDVSTRISWNEVEHAMNNFSLRPAPASMMRFRETIATVEHQAIALSASRDFAGGALDLGVDHAFATYDVTITNPRNADFFLNSLPDIDMARTGAFLEWQGPLGSWQAELGARLDAHTAEADEASTGPAVPMMPVMLANMFNMSEREWDDVTVDAVARAWHPINDTTLLRVGIARKSRVPTYLERFAWLPTPASAGLADGNTYVGDLELEPETAWIIQAGLDYHAGPAFIRPALFYQQVDNYIQGVAFDDTVGVIDTPVEMVSMMNGDATPLRFANVGAELYGFDGDFGVQLSPTWRLDGAFEFVRAKRRDIDDNLYRVAPASVSLALSHDAEHWSAGIETVWTADQKDVSFTNGEPTSEGYVVWNFNARVNGPLNSVIDLRVDNLLDEAYAPHLSGRNRNSGSAVGLGAPIPAAGRNLGIRLSWSH
ncbi:TonB-dependent receptor [Maricaulis sp.]|uniref:TonB-dependent receptor n=1 Tax=Maricaulis sp. TaxID=1486257 RepID=UPI001B14B148|nr:TonB-dependent receptor [Maricaulis sp.]MBO6796881.1 TonB-dependent receptor [Maricaulis sp.]